MKFLVNLFLSVAILFLFSGCTAQEELQSAEETSEVMGTILTITVYAEEESVAVDAVASAKKEIERINKLMSNWDTDSELSRLNKAAAQSPTRANPEIFALVQHAFELSTLTGGMYDITAGPLIRLWGFFSRNKEAPPTIDEIEAELDKVGYQKVELDQETKTLFFKVAGMEIDLGSIAKGYAVDKAVDRVRNAGASAALINLGGNIGSLNLHPDNNQWVIGIRDPRKKQGLLGTLSITQEYAGWGLASSGQYERYYIFDGQQYGHIINPNTGFPVDSVYGTTIFSKSAEKADVVSTATFVVPVEQAINLIKNTPETLGLVFAINPRTGEDVLHISREMRPYFKLRQEAGSIIVEEF
jgi:thiamine biosynthesis lipoprotein